MGVELESVVQFCDELLDIPDHPDYQGALNGLQVQGSGPVTRIAAAVDASQASIQGAADAGAELLMVHHGLFWSGLRPVTGRRYRRIRALLDQDTALYSAHLPLDAHPELGNCILLARALGLEVAGRFGAYEGADIGWWGRVDRSREDFVEVVADAVRGDVRLIPGGPEEIRTVAVVTGGAGSMIADAARAGYDAFVTGEGAHHTYFDAMELGVNVYYGGHYATETFGVRALARHVGEHFDVSWEFLELPTGL